MPSKGPISLQGSAHLPKSAKAQQAPILRLRIITAGSSFSGAAAAHPDTLSGWLPLVAPTTVCHAVLAGGSDCVAAIRADSSVPPGCVMMDAALQSSLHLCPDESHDFRLFMPPAGEPFDLASLEAEVRVMATHPGAPTIIEADETALEQALLATLKGLVVAVGQVVVLPWSACSVVARITATDTLDAAAQQDAISYHCFRGLVVRSTRVSGTAPPPVASLLQPPPPPLSSLSLGKGGSSSRRQQSAESDGQAGEHSALHGRRRLVVTNRKQRPPQRSSPSLVDVFTNDGEVFPVRRNLLRPCIALTGAVRADADGPPSITVDVGTLAFDRVLIFLEAEAAGRPLPGYGVHLAEELLEAAEKLQLRSLQEVCSAKLGLSQSRLRQYTFEEVVAANSSGSCWLLIDGMVLDVGTWLPEHPGGSTIIPSQGLNVDASRMFEVYHASRESFLYLKEFYIGEVAPEDRAEVPCAEAPSPEFLHQLRDFTTWRMPVRAKIVKNL